MARALDDELARNADALALKGFAIPDRDIVLSMFASSPDCIKILDLDGTLSFMTHGGMCAMEIDNLCDVVGRKWWDLWPENEAARLSDAVAAAAGGASSDFVAFCPTAKGTPRWWAVRVSAVPGADGAVAHVLAISRDVTPLMERQGLLEDALRHSELLRREVDHRVKNSLNLVSSMLNLKARSAVDGQVTAALEDAAMRVRTIASVHDQLYRGDSDAVGLNGYLAGLVADIQQSLAGTVTVSYAGTGAPVPVPGDVSVAMGLIVAELAGNALRHADLGTGGTIAVSLETVPEDGLCLTVTDTGCGLPADFDLDRVGMGLTVIKAMVEKIDGTLTCDAAINGGTRFCVTFRPPA